MLAKSVQVEDDAEQLHDDDGAAPVLKHLDVTIEQCLVDAPKIANTVLDFHKIEEAKGSVKKTADGYGQCSRLTTRQVDIQPCIKILPNGLGDYRITNGFKINRDGGTRGVLAEHSGTEIPTRITVTRKISSVETGTQWRVRQHGPVVQQGGCRARRNCGIHRRASGGK